MAKSGRDDEKLTDAEWDHLVRSLIQTVAQLATRNHGSATSVARAANLSKSSIAQMKKTGKASPVSFIRVAAHLAGLNDRQAKALLENPSSVLKNLEPASEVETLFNEIRKYYSDNELAAWLKLLRSKHKVESELGITVNASVNKTKRS
jgi:hypothetical protein